MKLNIGGVEEEVVTREEFPLDKAREILKDEIIAVLGYGVQGPAQALNMKDNGFKNIIIGQEPKHKSYWEKAINDGWVPGETLFPLEDAAERGTVIQYLVSDAAQMIQWPNIKPHLKEGDVLYFSHGFSIVYSDQTGVVPPKNIDVIMVAPKGSGLSVRRNFLSGMGINSSYAVHQDYTGRAIDRTLAIGIAIGSGYLFPTTFELETKSDHLGERGVLMPIVAAAMKAQYDILRARGHSPSEAFNESVEEATQSLYPLIGENGMDWMYKNCSTTAQRGALDWLPEFEKAIKPVLERVVARIDSGEEVKRVIEANSDPNYQEKLGEELAKMRNSEMWQAGVIVRSLRPERQNKK